MKESYIDTGRDTAQISRKNNDFIMHFLSPKRSWIKLIVLVNLIILMISIVLYVQQVNHLISYHFDSEQIKTFIEERYDTAIVGSIDESCGLGWYDVTSDMILRKGYYQYSVSYENTSSKSYVWIDVPTNAYHVMEAAGIDFEEGIHEDKKEFWVYWDVNATLRLNYNGTGSVTITDFVIQETPYGARLRLFYTLLALSAVDLLIAIYFYLKKHAITKQEKYIFAGLLTITLFSSYPLFVDYVIKGHDLFFHLTRLEGIKDGILSGQFPVRINPDFYNGYGYANPIFYGEIFLYIPALLRLIGFPLTKCYNIYVLLVNIFTCFGGYYCFKRIFRSPVVGLTVTLLYTLAPYRLMDVYMRAAVGEYTAMAFLPFVVYGLYRIYTEDVREKRYRWCFLPLIMGLAGILQTHVLTGEMVGGIILLVCVLLLPLTLQKQRLWALVKAVAVTVGINLWFIVPFLDYTLTQSVNVLEFTELSPIQNSGIFFTQLLSLFQNYTDVGNLPAGHGIFNEMPLTLGMPLVLGMVLCMVMIWGDGGEKHRKAQAAFLLVINVLIICMSTVYFPWDKITLKIPALGGMITSLQYLWRFLAPATVLAAIITGWGLLLLCEKEGTRVCVTAGLLLCVLTTVSGMHFMQGMIEANEAIRLNSTEGYGTVAAGGGSEYLLSAADGYMMTDVVEPRIYNGIMTDYHKQGTTVTFYVQNTEENCYVLLPLLNYKGYRINSENNLVTNGNMTSGEYDEIRIDLPVAFSGEVTLYYEGFWYWRLAELASAVCIILLIILVCRDKRISRNN